MKAVLAFLTLCGVIAWVEGACSVGDCTLGSQITGTAGCTTYQNYINCLTTEKDDCTDAGQEAIVQAAIDSNTLLRGALSCDGATCSVGACTLGSLSGDDACSNYDDYIECLRESKDACTASETVNKNLLEAAIETHGEAKDKRCGACGLTASTILLLLVAAIAALMN